MKKIAICLSGQPRTYKYALQSTLNFFQNNENYSYSYFCHAWDYNSYKVKHRETEQLVWESEIVDKNILSNDLYSMLNAKKVVIESREELPTHHYTNTIPWDSLYYSQMRANYLKRQYELENNMEFDFVIKSRYDLVFIPYKTFELDNRINDPYDYKKSYDFFGTHNGRMFMEYDRVNISDVIYYGSSEVIDVISDCYWYMITERKFHIPEDCDFLGPGTLLSEYLRHTNIKFFKAAKSLSECVYRRNAINEHGLGLHVEAEYDKIVELNNEIYT